MGILLLICLSAPLLVTADRGIMGMWVNTYDEEGCETSTYNTSVNDDFYNYIKNRLPTYTSLYPERLLYTQENVWGPRIMETWRSYQIDGDATWYSGQNHNDDPNSTVLIISSHGGVSGPSDGHYWFRFLNQDNDRKVDSTNQMTSEFNKCHSWWRNHNNWSRPLVRMGSTSSSTSIGDGKTRWIIFHTCHNLQVERDNEPDFDVQDLWGWNDLNGGYRMIMGGSGQMYLDTGTTASDFVDRQYVEFWSFKQAWFDTMDNEFLDLAGGDTGKCVVYAKGGSTSAAESTRDNDDFGYAPLNQDVPAATNTPDGWKTAYSVLNCEDN